MEELLHGFRLNSKPPESNPWAGPAPELSVEGIAIRRFGDAEGAGAPSCAEFVAFSFGSFKPGPCRRSKIILYLF